MTNEQIKQAYVIGKAAKGIIRYREFQKQAMMKQATESDTQTNNNAGSTAQPGTNTSLLGDYAVPTLTGAGITAAIGALINAARGKSVLNGLLVGALPGAAAGAGYHAMGDWDGLKSMFPKSNGQTGQTTEQPKTEKNPAVAGATEQA